MCKLEILISGGSGFLGLELRKSLSKLGHNVNLLVRRDKDSGSKSAQPRLLGNEKTIDVFWPEGIKELPVENFDYIIYLSYAPVSQQMTLSEVFKINFEPLELFVDQIKKAPNEPHIIFISSQSAKSSVSSNYGELKRKSEDLILSSLKSATIIRPGLIFGQGTRGLFSSIKKFIQLSPVVPLIGDSSKVIQPLYMKDFVEMMLKVSGISNNKKREGLEMIEVADRPISFHLFLRKIAQAGDYKRLFIRVPLSFVNFSFWVLENVFKYKKISSSSLLGFLQLTELDCKKAYDKYDFSPTELNQALKEVL